MLQIRGRKAILCSLFALFTSSLMPAQMNQTYQVIATTKPSAKGRTYEYTIVNNSLSSVSKLVIGFVPQHSVPGLNEPPVGWQPNLALAETSYTAPPGWAARSGLRGDHKTYWVEFGSVAEVKFGSRADFRRTWLKPGTQTSGFSITAAKSDPSYLVGMYTISFRGGVRADFVGFLKPSPADSEALKGPSELAKSDLDTRQWQDFQNSLGWKMKYPRNWSATGDDEFAANETPWITGPTDCSRTNMRCATIQMEQLLLSNSDLQVSPRDYLLKQFRWNVIRQGDTTVNGYPAYEMDVFTEDSTNQPYATPERIIAVRKDGQMVIFMYSETGKNMDLIRWPSLWKLTPVFEKVLSTFSFQ